MPPMKNGIYDSACQVEKEVPYGSDLCRIKEVMIPKNATEKGACATPLINDFNGRSADRFRLVAIAYLILPRTITASGSGARDCRI
jgi:hypothetical protein